MPLMRRLFAFGVLAFAVAVSGLSTSYAHAESAARAADSPSELAMLGDALIARPLLAGATVLGWAAFTVSLPVSALGGNVDQAAEKLVKQPARATLQRCLGCTPLQHEHMLSEKRTEKMNKKEKN